MRPLTEKDLRATHDCMATVAAAIVNGGQEAQPMVAFFEMHASEPGVIHGHYLVDSSLVSLMHESDTLLPAVKATLGTPGHQSPVPLRKALLDQGIRADIAVQVTEGWAAPNDGSSTRPSERADRVETLVVLVHVRTYSYANFMPIETANGKRHVQLRPLVVDGVLGGGMTIQGFEDMPGESAGDDAGRGLTSTQLPADGCPNCGHSLDAATSLKGNHRPQPGDVSVCAYCGTILKFDDELRMQVIDPEHLARLPEQQQRELARVRAAVRVAGRTVKR